MSLLKRKCFAGLTGFEPATYGMSSRRSNLDSARRIVTMDARATIVFSHQTSDPLSYSPAKHFPKNHITVFNFQNNFV